MRKLIATKIALVKPEKILDEIGVAPGQTAADFGSGSGFYTLPAARKVGASGKVYAIDILAPVLAIVAANARAANLANVTTVRADLEREKGSTLPDRACDVVVIASALFQSAKKEAIVEEAARVLKPGGALGIIEWQPAKLPSASSLHPIGQEEMKTLAAAAGFSFEKEFEVDSLHYGLLFRKPLTPNP